MEVLFRGKCKTQIAQAKILLLHQTKRQCCGIDETESTIRLQPLVGIDPKESGQLDSLQYRQRSYPLLHPTTSFLYFSNLLEGQQVFDQHQELGQP